jgi:uncharacterized membrane protein YesL
MSGSMRVIWEGLQDAFDSMAELVIANILWVLLTVPVLTAPAALAGAYYMTNLIAHRKPVTWRTFFEGFRQFFWLSWLLALANILAGFIVYANFRFYDQFTGGWVPYMKGFALGAGILWLVLQLYIFPLLIEQEDRRLRIALRNSLILLVGSPGLALVLMLLLGLFGVLSVILQVPWLIITIGLCTFLSNWCALHALDVVRTQQEKMQKE